MFPDIGGMQELNSDSYLQSPKGRVGGLSSVDLEQSEGKGLYQNPPQLLASGVKGETVPDSLPATPKSPPTRRVPPREGNPLLPRWLCLFSYSKTQP